MPISNSFFYFRQKFGLINKGKEKKIFAHQNQEVWDILAYLSCLHGCYLYEEILLKGNPLFYSDIRFCHQILLAVGNGFIEFETAPPTFCIWDSAHVKIFSSQEAPLFTDCSNVIFLVSHLLCAKTVILKLKLTVKRKSYNKAK